jgi:hypothetical protein
LVRANPSMPRSCTLVLMWGVVSGKRILSYGVVNRDFLNALRRGRQWNRQEVDNQPARVLAVSCCQRPLPSRSRRCRSWLCPLAACRLSAIYNIAADKMGTVVEAEPNPPLTGPTCMMSVKFPSCEHALPRVFRFEYEFVQTALTKEEIRLLQQLREKDRTISGNKLRQGLRRLIDAGFVIEKSLNISNTVYSITETVRAVLAAAVAPGRSVDHYAPRRCRNPPSTFTWSRYADFFRKLRWQRRAMG